MAQYWVIQVFHWLSRMSLLDEEEYVDCVLWGSARQMNKQANPDKCTRTQGVCSAAVTALVVTPSTFLLHLL